MIFVELRRLGLKNKFFDCLGTRGVAREIIKESKEGFRGGGYIHYLD